MGRYNITTTRFLSLSAVSRGIFFLCHSLTKRQHRHFVHYFPVKLGRVATFTLYRSDQAEEGGGGTRGMSIKRSPAPLVGMLKENWMREKTLEWYAELDAGTSQKTRRQPWKRYLFKNVFPLGYLFYVGRETTARKIARISRDSSAVWDPHVRFAEDTESERGSTIDRFINPPWICKYEYVCKSTDP